MSNYKLYFLAIIALLLNACRYTADDFLPEAAAPTYTYTTQELWTTNGTQRIYGILYTPQGVTGKRPLCIMSHGFGGTHANSYDYCPALAELGYMVYAFDFCGGGNFSRSDGATTQMSVLTECRDLEAVLDHFLARDDINRSRICLMGDSQGGLVTALVAAKRTDDIERICLFYPALNIPDIIAGYIGSLDKAPELFPLSGVMVGYPYFADIWPLVGSVYDRIRTFRGKVLLIQGSADTTVPQSVSDRAASDEIYGSRCEYHVISGADHVFAGNYRRQSLTYTIRFMTR